MENEIKKDEVKTEQPKDLKPKYILTKANAKKELDKLFDYYEIDIDEIEEKDLKKAIKGGQGRLIKAIRLGRLKIKFENGLKITQTLRSNGIEIIYRTVDGESKAAMDEHPAEAYNRRGQALAGNLSGLGETAIRKLQDVDMSLAEVLGLIFLAV